TRPPVTTRPPGVTLPQVAQEGLKVLLALPQPAEDQPMARPRVDGPEQDPLGIAAGNLDDGLLALERPGEPQRREPAQGGRIDEQEHRMGRHPFQAADKPPFFCARWGSLPA